MDKRTVFDSIPDEFERWRPRYCDELFTDLIEYTQLGTGKTALEIGPGTGQATEPTLKTGCDYLAIELGTNFVGFMKNRFGGYDNFDIVHADFETYDFGNRRFDLVYSAAAIQWIPEKIAYTRAYELLKPGGTLAMFFMATDTQPGGGYTEASLYAKIQTAYAEHFHPESPYTCNLDYNACESYGFVGLERREYPRQRVFTADEYISMISTHSDHITLKEPHRSLCFNGIRQAILDVGDRIVRYDKYVMYLAKKP